MADVKEFERYSWSDYRSWPEDERWELVEGVAWSMSPAPSRSHQKISMEVAAQFYNFFRDGGCEVYSAPFDVKLSPEAEDAAPTVLQPDIVLCCDPDKLTDWGIEGPPDLVVEIVSPESGRRDRKQKFELYERYWVGEYWIVDPHEAVVEIYRHDGGRLMRVGAYGPEDEPGIDPHFARQPEEQRREDQWSEAGKPEYRQPEEQQPEAGQRKEQQPEYRRGRSGAGKLSDLSKFRCNLSRVFPE